jgi:release factor glutamine methyltransferase
VTTNREPTVSPTHRTVSWRELLAETAGVLGDRREAKWICETAAGLTGDEWHGALDEAATVRMVSHLDAMVARRRTGEPIQYVLGSWPFRSLDLLVDRRVLIPRSETEEVAGHAIDAARALLGERDTVTVVDLGTGSGAIGLSLAHELPIGRATVWCTDVSIDALDVCRANLAGLGRRAGGVHLAEGEWFEALPADVVPDVVVSNPPYIAPDDTELDDSVREYEPSVALFGGPDGLDHYRVIVDGAARRLPGHGVLVLEIGRTQRESVTGLCHEAGFGHVVEGDDVAGHPRTVLAQIAVK